MAEPGRVFVVVGLAASVAAVVLYILAARGRPGALRAARFAFGLTALSAALAFGRLMWLIVNKRFQYEYVFEYASRDLNGPFLYASTWAGQEGSFLLWALCTAIIGVLVAWKAGAWEARVMPAYITSLTFVFAILAFLSPFGLLERGGAAGYPAGAPWPPDDGWGLNPLLQNYWMAIHPPVIFFGFASLAVPFAYAVAALASREYSVWSPRVMPWALMASATLGLGLFMGGYWAYETQGWHGFWAWDPVENASLFPWLASLALVHGLVVQRSRGGMARTNLFLAVMAWSLFLYGTFLTRSGALDGFSVHAFAASRSGVLLLLPIMVGANVLLGVSLLAWRWRSIPGRPLSDRLLSRDTAMAAAVMLMVVAAIVVTIGTSWPLLSRLALVKAIAPGLHAPKGVRVEPIFYNQIGSGLAILGLLALGVVPFLAWGKSSLEKVLWKVLLPWFAAVAIGFGVLAFGWREAASGFEPDTPLPLVVAIGTLGCFAAIANIALLVRVLRARAVTAGGWLAHVGVGLLLVGTVITNVYERTETFNLVEGKDPVRTGLGYAFQFAGWSHDDKLKRAAETGDAAEAERLRHEVLTHDWWQFSHGVRIRVIPVLDAGSVANAAGQEPEGATGAADPHAGVHGAPPMRMDPRKAGPLDHKGSWVAQATVFQHKQLAANEDPNAQQMMRWPYIHKEALRDVYISIASDPQEEPARATLRPGERATVGVPELAMLSQYEVEYRRFYRDAAKGAAPATVGGEFVLHVPDGRKVTMRPGVRMGGPDGIEKVNRQIPGVAGSVNIVSIDPATKEMTLQFLLPEMGPVWIIPVAVTTKPMINLVWLGVLMMTAGALLAMVRRTREARRGRVVHGAYEATAEAPDARDPATAAAPAPEPVGAGAR